MNKPSSTYCPSTSNATISGIRDGYTFAGKEKDLETGLSYFGARYYDADLTTGWLSVDPMANKYPSMSPYNYCALNPVKLVDPDGRDIWKPNSDGNLIAEKGDNAATLAAFLGISEDDAKKMLEDQRFPTDRNLDEKSVLKLDNVYTRSIAEAKKRNPDLDYNCFGSAICGTRGLEINSEGGMDCPMEFDNILRSDYEPITPDKAKFGKTILRFADAGAYWESNNPDCMLDAPPSSIGTATHGAVFYGKSNDGTIYVYTKNGWNDIPRIMKLKHLNYDGSLYGRVQGIGNDTGYYKKK